MMSRSWQGIRRLSLHATLIAAAASAVAVVPAPAATAHTSSASRYRQADRAVVSAARNLSRCQIQAGSDSRRCATPRKTLQTTGLRLSSIQSRLARAAAAAPSKLSATQKAPTITVTGTTLSWNRVGNVNAYVMVRKVTGMRDLYSVVNGTSVTPDAIPGKTVTYGLRTAIVGSAWGREVQIRYATDAQRGAPTPTTAGTGAATPTTTTPGSSAPPAAPPTPEPTPAPSTPVPSTGPFQVGINSGSAIQWQLGFIQLLHAKHVRMEFDISRPVSELAPVVLSYAQAGVQPLLLAGFDGRVPTTAEAQNLATWAAAFGPGGTFWQGKNLPAATQVTRIEFGNETNNPYQYTDAGRGDDWYYNAAFLQRAKTYALRVKDAQIAVSAANPNVGLLAVGDQYSGYRTWVDAMFDAVPDLGSRVAGWTVHPYGPNWKQPIDTMIAATRDRGAPDLPIYATEWGLSTDDGRCLSDNYGFDNCMSYSQAASTLHDALGGMRARYGSRLASVYLYSTSDLKPTGASTDREQYFGALRNDKSTKGAYTSEVIAQLAGNA